MYPQLDKNAGPPPSAPPPYSESINAPNPYAQNAYAPYPSGSSQYPPPQYSQQQPGEYVQRPTQVIVVQATPALPPLGPRSVEVTCPSCKSLVMSSVEEETSGRAFLCCMLMCIFGMWCCSYLPFCMDNFSNFKHKCPRCKTFFGVYQP